MQIDDLGLRRGFATPDGWDNMIREVERITKMKDDFAAGAGWSCFISIAVPHSRRGARGANAEIL